MEPENRLVARTLEAALEARLTAARIAGHQLAAQQARRPVTLTEQEAAWITTAGADLQAVFHAPTTTNVQRKQLLRAVIAEIVITVSPAGSSGKRTAEPADHLARRREYRTDRAAGQDRAAQPGDRRGHPGPGAPARRCTTTTPPSPRSSGSKAGAPPPG